MPTRRSFFSALAFGAATLWPKSVFARRRRRRRGAIRTPKSLKATSQGAFPAGYSYRDADVELIVPNLTQWAKLEIGMSADNVRRLLGRPIEGDDPQYEYKRLFQEYIELGLSADEAQAHAQERIEINRQEGIHYLEGRTYGWLKIGDGNLFWQYFTVSFENRQVFDFSDPFGGGQSILGHKIEARLSSDGRPTIPRLLTPYDNAEFTHSPPILDFRWLPSCGEYPLEYVVELTTSDAEIDEASNTATLVWLDDRPLSRQVTSPHLALNAPGGGRYRWRVKAKNRLGESDWSEYREFEF